MAHPKRRQITQYVVHAVIIEVNLQLKKKLLYNSVAFKN